MATVLRPFSQDHADDTRFFTIMACIMSGWLVLGFSTSLVLGRSSFALPLIFHIHAFVFFGWVALYLLQNVLVANGNVRLHRRLGWLALLWLPMMLSLGIAMTVTSVRRGAPFFFDVNQFLISNPLHLTIFTGLVLVAIRLRRQTDWHRRLMFCAFALLTGPAWGRLLPMPLMIPFAWWGCLAATMIWPAIGAIADVRRRGRVHPAFAYGVAAILASQVLADVIAYSPAGYAITRQVVAGTPGADRPIRAYLP
ncbi:hypothetical protein ACX40Y_10140 [Sphingomonas sp. RS6]